MDINAQNHINPDQFKTSLQRVIDRTRVIDIETAFSHGGLSDSQEIFAFAQLGPSDNEPKTWYAETKPRADEHTISLDYKKRADYASQSKITQRQLAENMADTINKSRLNNELLTAYNSRFDLDVMTDTIKREFTPQEWSEFAKQNKLQDGPVVKSGRKTAGGNPSLYNANPDGYDVFHSKNASLTDVKTNAYRYINRLDAGDVANFDILEMNRYTLAMADKAGVADFGGNFFVGQKAAFLEKVYNVAGGTGHVAGTDVKNEKGILTGIQSILADLYENAGVEGREIGANSKQTLQRLAHIAKEYKPAYAKHSLASSVYNMLFTPETTDVEGNVVKQFDVRVPSSSSAGKSYNKKFDINDETGRLNAMEANAEDVIRKGYGDNKTAKDLVLEQQMLYNEYSRMSKPDVEKNIMGLFDEESFLKKVIPDLEKINVDGAVEDALKNVSKTKMSYKKLGMYGVGALGLMYVGSKILGGSANGDTKASDIQIHGMTNKGLSSSMRHANTDFGSPWQGLGKIAKFAGALIKKSPEIAVEAVRGLVRESKANPLVFGGGFLVGGYRGFKQGKEENKISIGGFARNVAFDMADDFLVFGVGAVSQTLGNDVEIPGVVKGLTKIVETPLAKKGFVGFAGYTLGKILGEVTGKLFNHGHSDANIHGLRHGGVNEEHRHALTDFGSGYRGPHPELIEDYNNKKEVPAYQQWRASQIGLTEEEMYQQMAFGKKPTSEYVEASATSGTALHRAMQASMLASGEASEYEKLVYDPKAKVSGHADIITPDKGVGDIKTMTPGIYNATVRKGRPKPMHEAQVQFYMGQLGIDKGFVRYVNRENPKQFKDMPIQFNPQKYSKMLEKVEHVRSRVEADLASGKIKKSKIPYGASLETLEADNARKLSNKQMIAKQEEYYSDFQDEMKYFHSIKRPMPSSGRAHERISAATAKRKNQHKELQESTQGIGLQIWNNRQKHHYM